MCDAEIAAPEPRSRADGDDRARDPSFVISHRWPLSRAAEAYRMFNDKADDCTKLVLNPAA